MNEEKQIITEYVIYPTDKTKNKEWRRIMINGYKTDYIMDKNGTMINVETGCVREPHDYKDKYPMYTCTIKTNDGNTKYVLIFKHRLMCCLFLPIPKKYRKLGYKQENLCINHKDGNKKNCELSNLEWCTIKENNEHARRTGLIDLEKFVAPSGEANGKSTHTEKEIREICEKLQNGVSVKDICKEHGETASFVRHVLKRRTWSHISKDYDFKSGYSDFYVKNHLSEDKIREICELLVNTDMTHKQIAEICDVSFKSVSGISCGASYKEISKEYGIPLYKKSIA